MKEIETMSYYELLITKKKIEKEMRKRRPYYGSEEFPKWSDPFIGDDCVSDNDWDVRLERQRDSIDKAVSLANDLYYSTENLDFAVDTACRYLGYSFMKLG